MGRRTPYRLAFLLTLVLLGSVFAPGFATATLADPSNGGYDPVREGDSVAPPRNATTVIATDSNTWLGRASSGPRANAELLAVGPDGEVRYRNDSHTRYWDIDPVPGTRSTVEYVYADHRNESACGDAVCTRNGIERVNLTTGEVTDVFSRITPGKHSTRWHDADRINETRVVVADIDKDRVFVVDTETGIVEWAWSAQSAFAVNESGGPYPSDWTHLNDVEVLDDGRIMVSLRNHDQVVFLDRETGLIESWTLGRDGRHARLYEQHNPDYLPRESGGPSVLVADSENNRVVEYRRSDGTWNRTWLWSDPQLQWPRDADRLPNGHTLVTDSNGNRVVEVDEQGRVVWQLDVAFPYEAERLGTGDESTGGPAKSAGEAGSETPESGTSSAGGGGEGDQSGAATAGLTAGPLANAVSYVLPVWMSLGDLFAFVGFCLVLVGWLVTEYRWSSLDVTVRSPLSVGWDR